MTPVTRGMLLWARSQSVAVRLALLACGVVVVCGAVIGGTFAYFTLWGHADWARVVAVLAVLALVLVLCVAAACGWLAWLVHTADGLPEAMDRRDQ